MSASSTRRLQLFRGLAFGRYDGVDAERVCCVCVRAKNVFFLSAGAFNQRSMHFFAHTNTHINAHTQTMEHDDGIVCFRIIDKHRNTDRTAFVSWEQLECERSEGGHGDRLLFSLLAQSSPCDDIFDSNLYTGLDFVVSLREDDVLDTDATEFVVRNADVCSLLARATTPPHTGWESEHGRRVLRERALRLINTVVALTSSAKFPTHRKVSCVSLTLLITEEPQLCDTCR